MATQERVAIVTGGASGIGRALAHELARRGAVVVIADIRQDGAVDVARQITDSGGQALGVHADVSQAGDLERVVGDVVQRYGRLDWMFNNAGIGVGGEIRELNLEHWRAAIDVNLRGVVHGVLAAYPVMLRQGSGHIVNIASLAGLIPSPGLAPYATTKGAVISLTNALRAEGESFGVRASVACPGFVDTAIYENAIGVKVDKQALLERLGLPLVPAIDAARAILRGVDRNRAVIVFPWSARILWGLSRFTPWLLWCVQRRMLMRLRSISGRQGRVPD